MALDEASIKLIGKWKAGDQQAGNELFQRYVDRLTALARSRLSAKLSSRVDAEDVVQSAYRSFFARARDGQFAVDEGGDLWRLLVAITLHKLHDQVKRHTAEKRSVDAEHAFGGEDSLFGIKPEVFVQDPSPLAALALADEVEQFMRYLQPVDRRILELRLQGYTLLEIAELTCRSTPTISRLLERFKRYLKQHRPSSGL